MLYFEGIYLWLIKKPSRFGLFLSIYVVEVKNVGKW